VQDHKISINEHCPCTQPECPIRGNCVLCIQAHLDHQKHIPECMENLLRDKVKGLAEMMELTVADARPEPRFWTTFDRQGFLKECLEKHSKRG
jgi:hypothetical protein